MAEDGRELLSLADEQSAQLHGGKDGGVQEHDVHLVGNIVIGDVVGEVSAPQHRIRNTKNTAFVDTTY